VAVAFDAVSAAGGASSSASVTLSFTHTNAASGVDVLAGVAYDGTDSGVTVSCTVGGTSAPAVPSGSKIEAGTGAAGFLFVGRRTGVGSGAQTVTFTATSSATDMTGGSISFTGVTALGTPAVMTSGTGTNPSVNVAGVVSGSLVTAFLGCGNTINAPTGGGTSRYANNLKGGGGQSTGNCAGQTNASTGTVAAGWSSTGGSNALWAVELQAGAAAGGIPQLTERLRSPGGGYAPAGPSSGYSR